jgi:hypothetical protein
VENFRAVQSKNSGEADLRWKKPKRAKSCLVQYTATPVNNDNWKLAYPGKTSFTLKGLPRGIEQAIRIVAVLPGGDTVVSITINFIAM